MTTADRQVYDDIKDERRRQDTQWGGPEHDDRHAIDEWLDFIQKQLNEAEALIGADEPDGDMQFRSRLVKVAALAVAAVESLDRLMVKS